MSKLYNNPIYKAKHKEYIMEKVKCECGTFTARCNMSHHKKTSKHVEFIKKQERIAKAHVEEDKKIEYLELEIKRLKSALITLTMKGAFK